jgi:hypothetical protein
MQHVACAVAPIPAHAFLSRRFSRVRSATTSFKAVASRRRSFTSPDVAARAVSPANRRCRPQGIPSSSRNTSRRRCLRGGKAPRLAGQGIPDRQESNSTFRRGLLPFPRWDPVGVCVGCCPERRCRMASRTASVRGASPATTDRERADFLLGQNFIPAANDTTWRSLRES